MYLSMVLRFNVVQSTMTSRFRDFLRMNPPIFHGSKVGEDPQDFFDEVYKTLSLMSLHIGGRLS